MSTSFLRYASAQLRGQVETSETEEDRLFGTVSREASSFLFGGSLAHCLLQLQHQQVQECADVKSGDELTCTCLFALTAAIPTVAKRTFSVLVPRESGIEIHPSLQPSNV